MQREIAFRVSRAGSSLEIGLAEIRMTRIEMKPNLKCRLGLGKLTWTLAINGLFEQLDSLVWLQATPHRRCLRKVALLTFLGAGHLHAAVMDLEAGLARHPFLSCRSLSQGHFRLIDLYRDRLHDNV